MRRRTVRTMEKQKKKHPCSGCVWRVHTSEDKVLCMFPSCVKKEYERYWPQGKQSNEEAKAH